MVSCCWKEHCRNLVVLTFSSMYISDWRNMCSYLIVCYDRMCIRWAGYISWECANLPRRYSQSCHKMYHSCKSISNLVVQKNLKCKSILLFWFALFATIFPHILTLCVEDIGHDNKQVRVSKRTAHVWTVVCLLVFLTFLWNYNIQILHPESLNAG